MTQRSHFTQVLQNYFDATDRRTRENPIALESQMLNMAGTEMESLIMRLARETSQTLQTVPIGIDNKGVYYSSRVPDAVLTGPDQTTFNSVVAAKGSNYTTLTQYDDTLPIPSRVEIDSANIVAMTNPVMFTLIGVGDSLSQTYSVQYVYPGVFPIPNQLTLWADNLGMNIISLTLTITGETAPQPAWSAERRKTTEIVTITGQGAAYSRNRWSSIDQIAVRGLPVGVSLSGWSLPFNLPAAPDPARPYTTPEDRDTLYPRYWQVSNSERLLYEMYRAGGFSGLEPVNSYSISDTLVDVAVEPFTNGIYLVSSNKLYYGDRREYQADLKSTGILAEPLYGLQVSPDITKTGPTRYVVLSGLPYANAGNIFNYRYTVRRSDSLSTLYSILPNGALAQAGAGWRNGIPQPVSVPLLASVDYEFRLETQDLNGQTAVDVVPYRNAVFTPLKTIDLSLLVDNVLGMAFDSYGKLWLWNGDHAMPVKIHYDGYVFDADTATVFVTEQFDSLQIT
jgi:hypothetical protein